MDYFKSEFFHSEGKARYFAKKVKGDLYHWSPRSKTKIEYRMFLEEREFGHFDEDYANQFPWLVHYLDMKKATQD